jgi:hypothetical protein
MADVDWRLRRFREREAELEQRLKAAGGDGTSGGMSDDWKESVNEQLKQLHGDVRNLLYGVLGSFVILTGAGATAYVKLSDQVTEMRVAQAQSGARFDAMDAKLDELLDREKPARK